MKTDMIKAETQKVNANTGELIIDTTPSTEEIVVKVKGYLELQEKKVFFNGKRYPVYGDWQYVGSFYGITVKTFNAHFVEIGGRKGFSAQALLLRDQLEIGRAEGFCLDDEPNWRNKPLFQLASMAQTRAAAKAYANLFRHIVSLAGLETSPAEEMMEENQQAVPRYSRSPEDIKTLGERITAPTPHEVAAADEVMTDETVEAPIPDHPKPGDIPFGDPKPNSITKITRKQQGFLFVKAKQAKVPDKVLRAYMKEMWGVEHSADLPWQAMQPLLDWIAAYKPVVDETFPF